MAAESNAACDSWLLPQLPPSWACRVGDKRGRDAADFDGPVRKAPAAWAPPALRAHNPPLRKPPTFIPGASAPGGGGACCGKRGVACPCGWRGTGAEAFAQHAQHAHGLPRYIAAGLR
jgi:hypothetical protein